MPLIRTRRVRAVLLVGGLVLLVLLFARLGPGRILSLLSALGVNFIAVVLLFACHEGVRALAVGRFLPADQRPPWRSLLRIRFLGDAIGAVTRTGMLSAEPVRAWLLAGSAGSGAHAYAAAASELIANSCTSAAVTVAVAGWMLLALELHGSLLVLCHILFWGSLVYICSAVGALAARVYLIGAILGWAGALPFAGRYLRTDPIRVRVTEDAIIHALTGAPSTVAQVVLLECLAQAILVSEVYVALRSMNAAMNVPDALYVEVLTKAANIIQLIGVTEAGYAVVFDWLGLTAALGFTLSLVKVLRSLTAAGLGLVILNQLDRRWSAIVGAVRGAVRADLGGGGFA